jgi:hypothetical protein
MRLALLSFGIASYNLDMHVGTLPFYNNKAQQSLGFIFPLFIAHYICSLPNPLQFDEPNDVGLLLPHELKCVGSLCQRANIQLYGSTG